MLNEPDEPVQQVARPLLDLPDPRPRRLSPRRRGSVHWSLLDPKHALLKLAVRARAPVRFDLDILLPARPALGVLDVLARDATIALTTPAHASRLLPG